MGITQDSSKGANGELEEELAKLHLGHKGFFLWEIKLGISNYSFSDFLLQIKLCTYKDSQRISESKLLSCIRNIIQEKEKSSIIAPIFESDSNKNTSSIDVNDATIIFFLLSKAVPITSPKGIDLPLYDKAYYFLTKCSNEGDEAISLKAFAAFILNQLIPMLHQLILSYRRSKSSDFDYNEERLEMLQKTIKENKTQFFSFLLSDGASDLITIQELNQRFTTDCSFLTADYLISAYFQQSFKLDKSYKS